MKDETCLAWGLGSGQRRLWQLVCGGLWVMACSAPADPKPGSTDEDPNTIDPGMGSGSGIAELAPTPNCGDGKLDDDEGCDDGNLDSGDGCLGNCRGIEKGFICPKEGMACLPFVICGDGSVAFPEQCDDKNRDPGDGCNENCKVEIGFKCPAGEDGASVCVATTCGDGIVEGAEMCEPGADERCTSQCQFAPFCGGDGACTSVCGDGLVLDEPCDDGNLLAGDGCDPNCQVEAGYECPSESTSGECKKSPDTGECILTVPVTYRDFASAHSDFEVPCSGVGAKTGLLNAQLSAGKPSASSLAGEWDPGGCITNFPEWYNDSAAGTTFHSSLVLYESSEGVFVNRWGPNGEKWAGMWDGTPFFYPVDNIPDKKDDGGIFAQVSTSEYGMDGTLRNETDLVPGAPKRNFSFTSEVTYWFAYDAETEATLSFIGDDDVWVFVNGRLALDLGGVHPGISGSFTISGGSPTLSGGTAVAHQMTVGKVYEIKVFHAERRSTGSTFKLTLSGFDTERSNCAAICGDGIIGFGEECDDGENAGGYNRCGEDCRLGAYCGDGVVEDAEECDDADPERPANCSGCRVIVVR